MQKVALYRKYRPENFDDTIGQEHIVRILMNAVKESKISHAYLFSGPRGTGKTSTARVLAKAINCKERKDHNPCGKCSVCVGIAQGRIMDLIEIDAASNRGIDEIRDLREKVKFSPTEADYKVFIIDEVHMLTKEAFNALLKTLEEPPSHVIFILATTEINKVPATILSRCQRHDFRRIKLADIVSKLVKIKKSEKINISDEALEMIAESSEGGLRDAEMVLEQLSSIGIEKIEVPEVENILGLAPHKIVVFFVTNLLAGNKKEALSVIEKASTDGINLIIFTKTTLEFLRKLLSVKLGSEETIEATKEQITEIKKLAKENDQDKMIALIENLLWASSVFKTSVEPKAILTLVTAKDLVRSFEPKSSNQESSKEGRSVTQEVTDRKDNVSVKNNPKEAMGLKPNGKWQHFLMEIKAKNNTLHAFLRVANPAFEGTTVVLTFPYKFHKERIEESRNKRTVEEILRKIYGGDVTIKCEMVGNSNNHKVSDVDTAASILGGEVVD